MSAHAPSAHPNDVYDSAESALAAGRAGDAVDLLRAALDNAPRAAQSVYLLGQALLIQGRYDEARLVIERAYDIKAWVREPSDRIEALRPALRRCVDAGQSWPWVTYQLELGSWFSVGLTLDEVVKVHLVDDENVVVQVGANDGQSGDPIARHLLERGWRGLLLEPQAEPYGRLRDRYATNERIETVNRGVADHDGVVDLYLDEKSRSTLASLVPDRNVLRQRTTSLHTVPIDVATFATLFADYAIDRVDLLQIDTEGYDYEVLRTFDLVRFRPMAINMEFYLLTIDERLRTFELLRRHGYAWRFAGRDLLAVDRARIAPSFCVIPSSQ